jgi:hypothetical protein
VGKRSTWTSKDDGLLQHLERTPQRSLRDQIALQLVFANALRTWASGWPVPRESWGVDKSHLAPLRLLHFLGLASLAADTTRLARPDEALDEGDDSLRRKLASDLLPRRFAVVYGLRDPVPVFQYHRYAGCHQHGRDCPHDRRSDSDDLDLQTGPAWAKVVLRP